jgi:copper chaperone CopZ
MDETCHVDPITKTPDSDEIKNIQTAFLHVWGMGCPNCANRVRNSLLSLNGVVDARVDHNIGKAQIAYNPDLATSDDLISAISNAGGDGHHEYDAQLVI